MPTETRPTSWPRSKRGRTPFLTTGLQKQGLRSPEKRNMAHGDRENSRREPLRADQFQKTTSSPEFRGRQFFKTGVFCQALDTLRLGLDGTHLAFGEHPAHHGVTMFPVVGYVVPDRKPLFFKNVPA
jgi:hypothetical protein